MDTNREIIEKKDEKIAQLEKQLTEILEAQQQSAATIAVEHNSRSLSPPTGIFKSSLGAKSILIIFVILAIISSGVWIIAGSTFKQESVLFVEHVQELATLATAQAHVKVIINEEDNEIFGKDISKILPGTKRKLLLVVPGTVIAGVDLKGITSEDMVINEETKEIDITLPHAKFVQDPSLQMDKILFVDDVGLFRADFKMDEGFKKAAEAQELIRHEAESIGLLDTAEKNAEKVLKEFFKNMGYTINITFN